MTTASTSTATPFPFFRLLVISGAIFVSVSSEFLPTGLLPDIAADLGVSESRVGLLVAIFAGTVVVSTTPLAALTRRVPRKRLMVMLLAGFAVTNVLCAVAPSYEFLVVARVLGGLCHGLFWAVTGPYASRLVEKHQLARAVSVTGIGGTMAFVLGVPVGTAIGHLLDWRLAFVVMGAAVLVFAGLVILFLPPVEHLVPLATGEIAIPTHRDRTFGAVLVVCVTVVLLVTGQNVFYTFITPWLIEVGGIAADAVPLVLFAYGAAGVGGLLASGAFGDRYPRATQVVGAVVIAGAVVYLGAVAAAGATPWLIVAGVIVWSIGFGTVPPLLGARVLQVASVRIRDVASAYLTTSFNIAIGLGSLIGGLLVDGFGFGILPWAMAGLVAVALLFIVGAAARQQRRAA